MASNSILVKILGDSKGLTSAIGTSQSAVSGFSKGVLASGALLGTAFVGALVGLGKLGSTFDTEYDKIRVGTGATGDALQGLQGDFDNLLTSVPTDFDSAGTAIADLNTRLGLTGDDLTDLSTQFINLSRITGTDLAGSIDKNTRVFGDWGIATEDQAGRLDELYRASQASGISMDELSSSMVSNGAPLRNLGFTFEESAALLGQFNKTGVNTETVFAGLKAGVGKLAKEGEPIPETFARIVDEITAMGPGTEATGLAIELFGQRAGPDLADAIAGGKFEIGDMLAAITDGTDTINGAAKDTESFGEKWLLLKNRVFVGLKPLALGVFNAMGTAMDALGPPLEKILTYFSAAIPQAIAFLTPTFDAVVSAIRTVIAAFSGDGAEISDGPLQTYGLYLREIVDFIQANVPPALELMVAGFQTIADWVEENWPAISEVILQAVTTIQTVITAVVDVITALWGQFGDDIMAVIQIVAETIVPVITGALDIISGVFDVFAGLFTGDWGRMWEGIKSVLSGAVTIIKAVVKAAFELLKTIVGAALEAMFTVIKTIWGTVVTFFSGIGGKIKDAVGNVGSILTDTGKAIIQGLLDGIQAKFGAVKDKLGELTGLLPDWKGPYEKDKVILKSAGQAVISGFNQGLEDEWATTRATLQGFTAELGAGIGGASSSQTVNNRNASFQVNVYGDTQQRLDEITSWYQAYSR